MRFDVAVVGAPFLDLTFEGIPHVPEAGEEVVGTALHVVPGGTGTQAAAAARLGLRTALVSPIGRDPAGRILRDLLEAEGVQWLGPTVERTPVTAILPSRNRAAMVTFQPRDEVSAEDVARAEADAVVLSLGRLRLRPADAAVYVVTGPGETGRFGRADLPSLDGTRAVVMNEHEARMLTGTGDAESAARMLSDHTRTAVVTRGADGAVGTEGTRLVDIDAPDIVTGDATGAGDLFVAAYVWADVRGHDLEARLRWATLFASLAVPAPTAFAGAPRLEELFAEGERRGLRLP